ncbi:polysaccharide deacetylase family protein [Postechiella marina]|uniref:Polysaccharide deacetylase family protein n=1 Tax=Postechiella marina TaxID=943941 RepID=A0ABP8C7E0_9FLAO
MVLSYDDGTIEDIELARLFDKNKLVGTFNLNSRYLGVTRSWPQKNGDTIYQKYVPKDSLLIIYKNHEIAAHGTLHKNFGDILNKEILEEVNTDIDALTKLTNKDIVSLAYPFGNTNASIAKLISRTGIINGRTVADTYKFSLPEHYMMWHPTCHDSKALDYLSTYLEMNNQELSLFYVWGHSWEFGDVKRWYDMVKFCNKVGKAKDIWSVGNGELTKYLKAIENIEIKNNRITNPVDNEAIWINLSTGIKKLNPGNTIKIKTMAKSV